MKALVVGAGGQVGRELAAALPAGIDLVAFDRAALDIADREQVLRTVAEVSPEVIINAAAYNAVDRAETEPGAAQEANATAVGFLAEAASASEARLVHVSTDFVFDGRASRPYRPADQPNPTSVYARSKLDGEKAALAATDSVVVRTSRVYSHLGRNFVTVMLGLMSTEDELRVVDDQVGAPTHAGGLAPVLWAVAARRDLAAVWHWTDAGSCSWFDWACAIQEEALKRGLVDRAVPVHPIQTADYPTPASRPAYSVLDCTATVAALGIEQRPWREALGTMLDQMSAQRNPHS